VPQERSLREFLVEAPVACHEIDISGRITFVNKAECRLLGLTQDQLLQRSIWDFVSPEEQAVSREAVRQKIAGERALTTFERDYVCPDGTRLVLEIQEQHIRDANSRIIGMRSFLFDVTRRERTEQALRESERLYRHVVEHASDIIYRTDVRGRFQILNPVASQLLGYTSEDLTGKYYLDLIQPDYRARVRRFYRRQLVERLSHTYLEFPALTRDGKEIWFGQNAEIILENDRAAGFQAITRDISQQRSAEERLKNAREELEQRVRERTADLEYANELLRREMSERQKEEKARLDLEKRVQHTQRLESLGVLAGGIAHDFNNLLAVIMGHAGLALQEVPTDSRARERLSEVISAATSAAQLTEQMLAYSGRGKFTVEPINLSQLIEDAARLITTLISKKATVRLVLDADIPSIEGDPAQIRQVVINLLTNASDALCDRAGTIDVTTGVRRVEGEAPSVLPDRRLAPGKYVFLEVKDSGCGMDRATSSRIFEPFFTTKFTVLGLGLAAVQGIVRGHRGALQVDSEPERGATFRVLFPATGKTVRRAAPARAAVDREWRPEGTVLVVDDEPAVRSLSRQILEGVGIEVIEAIDGYDAVRVFEANAAQVNAVLLDLTMPGLDGGEVFAHLIRMKPEVKVILCSGYDAQDVNSKIAPHQPAGFLRKPYGPADLLVAFRSVL
jgi:two-component system, cell cycle sensor histidine kinase and response regulator CckA